MANKLFIRKVSVTRTYYETAVSYAPRGIQVDDIKSREIPNSYKMAVHEDWREATEPEAILAGFSGDYRSNIDFTKDVED